MNYVFSDEIYIKANGKKPRHKGVWVFGDRNKTYTLTVGDEAEPINYTEAKKRISALLDERRSLLYKTVYLHDFTRIKPEKRNNKIWAFGGKIKQLLEKIKLS